MCGILGYVGLKQAAPVLVKSLKNMEYRGYDSCGITVVSNKELRTEKSIGKINNLQKKTDINGLVGKVGIGHTRWATHGTVTEENAHPHMSNNNMISVVHNGIIENFLELRNFLKDNGFLFYSETDSEIIPNMIEYYMQFGNDFVESIKLAVKRMEGQYAIIAVNDNGEFVAVRKEAPLVVGLGKTKGEFFVSSDVTGFLEYSKEAVFLEEGDMVIIDNGNSIDAGAGADTDYKMKLFNINTDCVVKRPVTKLDWDAQQAQKGKFDHFYLKEVMEQAEAMEKLTKMDTCLIEEMACEIKNAREVYMVACGTASYTCMHALYIFSKICNVHLNFCAASEFYHFKNFVSEKSVVFAVSQSGETADTLSAIRIAKEKGAKVLSITNVMGSSLMRESDKCILQNVGPEIAVNSTKAYTSQLAILTFLAYAVDGRINEGIEEMKELPRHIYYLTSENARKSTLKLAEKLMNNEHLFVIGRGLQYPTALEAAHKIKEVSYIHTEAFAGGELKHGANALITKGTPYIVFSSDETEKEIISNAMEVKSRGAFVIGVGPKRNDVFDVFVKVPETRVFNPIVQIIPLQIVAYQLAVLRGCDPDFPRNLAKSVTVK